MSERGDREDYLIDPEDDDETARAKLKAQAADPNSPFSQFSVKVAEGARAEFAAQRQRKIFIALIIVLAMLVVFGVMQLQK